jgi:hypothetical protein
MCRPKKEKRDSVVEGDFNSRAFVLFPFSRLYILYIYIYIYECMCLHKGKRTSIEIFIASRSFLFSPLFTLYTFVERTRDIRCSSSSKVRFSRFIPVCSLMYVCVLTSFSPPLPFSLLNICTPFSRLYFIQHRANIKMSERTQDEFSYVDDGGGRTDDRLQYALTISRFIILFLSRRALRI